MERPNDLLSWLVPDEMDGINVVNIPTSNAGFKIPLLFASPGGAHGNYATNRNVLRTIFKPSPKTSAAAQSACPRSLTLPTLRGSLSARQAHNLPRETLTGELNRSYHVKANLREGTQGSEITCSGSQPLRKCWGL